MQRKECKHQAYVRLRETTAARCRETKRTRKKQAGAHDPGICMEGTMVGEHCPYLARESCLAPTDSLCTQVGTLKTLLPILRHMHSERGIAFGYLKLWPRLGEASGPLGSGKRGRDQGQEVPVPDFGFAVGSTVSRTRPIPGRRWFIGLLAPSRIESTFPF